MWSWKAQPCQDKCAETGGVWICESAVCKRWSHAHRMATGLHGLVVLMALLCVARPGRLCARLLLTLTCAASVLWIAALAGYRSAASEGQYRSDTLLAWRVALGTCGFWTVWFLLTNDPVRGGLRRCGRGCCGRREAAGQVTRDSVAVPLAPGELEDELKRGT